MQYDLIVIGGGAGGITAAKWAAKFGAKVALIDKKPLGGDCLFYGCVPSKSLIKSAKVASTLRHADRFGLDSVHPTIHWEKVIGRVQSIIEKVATLDNPENFRKLGIDVIFGSASFIDDKTINVILNEELKDIQQRDFAYREGHVKLVAKKVIIATGSKPAIPQIDGLHAVGYITNEDVFSLKNMSRSLLVVGGGPIACELAQAFSRLGSKVTMVVRGNQLLNKEDSDLVEPLLEKFVEEGIEVVFNVEFNKFEFTQSGNKKLDCLVDGKAREIKAEEVLVATGRKPCFEGLDLDAAGVTVNEQGIVVDKRLRTKNKKIFAIGDVNGMYQFTHAAGYEAAIAVTNAVVRYPVKVDYDSIPWTTFTDPEVAHCGLNEIEAKKRGIKYDVWKADFADVDRALAESEESGFIKILTKGKKAEIIGAQIVGAHAGELIHEFVLARNNGLTLEKIAGSVHVYPTLADIARIAAAPIFDKKYFTPMIKSLLRRLFSYKGR